MLLCSGGHEQLQNINEILLLDTGERRDFDREFMLIAENLYLKNKVYLENISGEMHDVLKDVKSVGTGHDFPPEIEALIQDYTPEDLKKYSSRTLSDTFWKNFLEYGKLVHEVRLKQEASQKEKKEEVGSTPSPTLTPGYTSSSEKKHTTEEESERQKNKPK